MHRKPELCVDCECGNPRAFCHNWPFVCRDRREAWEAGFAAALASAAEGVFVEVSDTVPAGAL
jgi:hypothetical protein